MLAVRNCAGHDTFVASASAPVPGRIELEGGGVDLVAVITDAEMSDGERRERLYAGDIFVYSPTTTTEEYCAFTRQMIREAFGDDDPETMQYRMDVHEYAAVLADLKPRFIHDDESKRYIRAILRERGCDPDDTYFDVPRLRSSTSDGYLTTGIAFAFHPHRDTWYSAPMCQINWWMPVFPVSSANGMAFYPHHFSEGVANTSAMYDYQRWTTTNRFTAARHVGSDTREQPKPVGDLVDDTDLRIAPPVGALIVFSAAQLHASVENLTGRTRFSIDFRTVAESDAASATGAPNIDSYCTGTSMGDYLRVSDLAHLPPGIVDRYLPGHPDPAPADRGFDAAAGTTSPR